MACIAGGHKKIEYGNYQPLQEINKEDKKKILNSFNEISSKEQCLNIINDFNDIIINPNLNFKNNDNEKKIIILTTTL